MKNTVLVVDKWSGWQESAPIEFLHSKGFKVCVVDNAAEASGFFNGKATARVLIAGNVLGVHDLIRDVKSRFAGTVRVVGLAEYREALSNIGCNCFVGRNNIHLTARAFLVH